MRDRHGIALAPSPALWPPDDTEESVLGTNLHQTTITNLRVGLNEAAAIARSAGAPVAWQAGGQTMIRGFRRPDGTAYTVLPDVFVYRVPWDDDRGSLQLATDGPPVLIIEVLSEETYRADVDLELGKGYSYRVAGVQEYLALDPTHTFVPEGGRGWQLDKRGAYVPWRREANGRWASAALPLAISLEGAQAGVHGADGRRMLREGEVELTLRAQQQRHEYELAALEQRYKGALQEYAAELERLRRRIEKLEGDG